MPTTTCVRTDERIDTHMDRHKHPHVHIQTHIQIHIKATTDKLTNTNLDEACADPKGGVSADSGPPDSLVARVISA